MVFRLETDMALKTASPEQKKKSQENFQKWRKANPEKIKAYAKKYGRRYYDPNKRKKIRDENTPPSPGKPESYRCKKCGEVKKFTRVFFAPHYENKWRLSYTCRTCFNAYYYVINAARRYGVSKEEAAALRKIDYCEICGSTGKMNIDHSHRTGKVRGVLCSTCNNGLGCFLDNVATMKSAIEYILRRGV